MKVTSTMGRIPVIAAPIAQPEMAFSEIGVSRIRSAPNSSSIPTEVPKSPPKIPTSSPMRNTFSSLRISSDIAIIMASLTDINLVSLFIYIVFFYYYTTCNLKYDAEN